MKKVAGYKGFILQKKQEGNSINYIGSNQVIDILLDSLAVPFFGLHFGVLLALIVPVIKSFKTLDKSETVFLSGHSFGGAAAQIHGFILLIFGYKVVIVADGSFRCVSWWAVLVFRKLGGICEIYISGNDPVPWLFPWLFHLGKIIFIGDDFEFVKINFKDHIKYK